MIYRVIGLMSGSSLDGLDIAFVEFEESGGKWKFNIKSSACKPYNDEWMHRLQNAVNLSAYDYLLLHASYGRFVGEQVNEFIKANELDHQVQLIASHGHTVFHSPENFMSAQLGDGAAIAAITGINVVNELRAMDVNLGGQGAPIVPIGEKLLLGDYAFFLNIGGIANVSYKHPDRYIAFDVCAANRVLNMFCEQVGKAYDDGGQMAAKGTVHQDLLSKLNGQEYYDRPYPKSLDNKMGVDVLYGLIDAYQLSVEDSLCTYVEHIAEQLARSCRQLKSNNITEKMLVTGGGAFNTYLISRLQHHLSALQIECVIPDAELINFKEALVMALIGILRWREENNVLSSVTGANRDSINGAVWIGQEA